MIKFLERSRAQKQGKQTLRGKNQRKVAETRDISLEIVTMSTERKVDLTYEDIQGLKSQKAIVLVDVRDHNEIQETGKLPDSIHIPLPELNQALQLPPEEFQKKYDGAELPLKSAPLVFSCRSGNRSRRAMNAALELGFAESRHYIGGFLDWQAKTGKK